MGPDRSNYQIWLIDYLDGNLDQEESGLLIAFLEKNPDLKDELSDLAPMLLQPRNDRFRNRDGLMKKPSEMTDHQFERLCVASAEGDLNQGQESELEEILSASPAKRKTYDLIRSARLRPRDISYRYKYRLRKLTAGQKVFRYSLISISAAAVVLIMISVFRRAPASVPGIEPVTAKRDTLTGRPEAKEITRPFIAGTIPKTNVNKTDAPAADKLKPDEGTRKIIIAENTLNANPVDSSIPETRKTYLSKIDYSQINFMASQPATALADIKIAAVSDEPEMEYSRIRRFLTRFLREKIIKSDFKEKGSLKGYELADAGIIGLNKLLGWDMSLQKKRNDKGEVMSVHFNSKLLKFTASVKPTSE